MDKAGPAAENGTPEIPGGSVRWVGLGVSGPGLISLQTSSWPVVGTRGAHVRPRGG